MDFTVIILLITVAFMIASIVKLEVGYYVMIFAIPFVYRPLITADFSNSLGFNSFFVIGLTIIIFFYKISGKVKTTDTSPIKTANLLITIVIIYGALVYIIKEPRFNNFQFEYFQDDYESFINFSGYLILLIFFNYTMDFIKDNVQLQRRLVLVFIFTSLFHILNDFLFIAQINIGLPSALVFGEATLLDIRLAGLMSDYELMVDYSLIIIGLVFVYYIDTGKKYILAFIAVAIVLSLFSGTRSFLITLSVFVLFFVTLNLFFVKDKSYNFRIFLFSFIGIAVLIVASTFFLEFSLIFERFSDSLELLKYKEYEGASNRSYIESLPRIIEYAGYLGVGSLNVVSIEKDPMVFHSLYLGIYNKYGLFGVGMLLLVIYIIMRQQIIVMRQSMDISKVKKAVVFIALIIALLTQQAKITLMRDITFMLMYAFLIWNMYFLYRQFQNEEVYQHDYTEEETEDE